MAWTAPATYAVGQTMTAAAMNLIRDNLKATVHALSDLTILQSGTTTVTLTAVVNNTKVVTFPTAFSTVPLVIVGVASNSTGGQDFIAGVYSGTAITASAFTAFVEFEARTAGTGTATITWVAVGT